MTPCTAPSALSREAALRRLAETPATKRGGRLGACVLGRQIHLRDNLWGKASRHAHTAWGAMDEWWRHVAVTASCANDSEAAHVNVGRWQRYALPLRKAREERRGWRSASCVYLDEIRYRDVGAALLAFFTDLAILTRQTPAPCPCCGNADVWGGSDGEPVECNNCGLCGPFDSETREDGRSDCCQMWNSFAVPAAFARLSGGG